MQKNLKVRETEGVAWCEAAVVFGLLMNESVECGSCGCRRKPRGRGEWVGIYEFCEAIESVSQSLISNHGQLAKVMHGYRLPSAVESRGSSKVLVLVAVAVVVVVVVVAM